MFVRAQLRFRVSRCGFFFFCSCCHIDCKMSWNCGVQREHVCILCAGQGEQGPWDWSYEQWELAPPRGECLTTTSVWHQDTEGEFKGGRRRKGRILGTGLNSSRTSESKVCMSQLKVLQLRTWLSKDHVFSFCVLQDLFNIVLHKSVHRDLPWISQSVM